MSKRKKERIEILKMLISSKELSSQEEVLQELAAEGYDITQATLSRDMKQLRIAKAASMNGKSVYVLPNETMYRRIKEPETATALLHSPGFVSLNYSSNIAVIKTRPGYASAIAYNIDISDVPEVLGTIAGDDTIFLVLKDGTIRSELEYNLSRLIPNLRVE